MKSLAIVLLLTMSLVIARATEIKAQIFFEPLYNDGADGIRFLDPRVRSRQSNPNIFLEFGEITIKVGETVLIPGFSLVEGRVPFPISWAIGNDRESVFTAILDEARPVATNRESWMLVGPGLVTSTNLRGPSAKSPVEDATGCERRFYHPTKLRFESGIRTGGFAYSRSPTAYICVHGVSAGKGQLIVGENFPEGEFGSIPSGYYTLLNRKSFVNQNARVEIAVEVEAGAPSEETRNELAFAEAVAQGSCVVGDFCALTVAPLNRGGEALECGDQIEVNWGTATGVFEEQRDKCTIKLRAKSFPPKGADYSEDRYGVRAVVSQVIEREMTNPISGKTIKVESVRQAQAHFLVHPVVYPKKEDVMWGRLACPKFVAPGIPFRCDSLFSSDDGNKPSSTGTLDVSNWRVPKYVSPPTVSTTSIFGFCMTVDDDTANNEVFRLVAQNQTNGISLRSREITISHELSSFVRPSKGC